MKTEMKKALDEFVSHLVEYEFFLGDAVRAVEMAMISKALEKSGGNRSESSRLLGIHRNTLKAKIAEYDLERIPRKPPQRVKAARRVKVR